MDRGKQVSTGCGQHELVEANAKLQQYREVNSLTRTSREILDHYLYFVSAEAHNFPVKIGTTRNRFTRFRSIQVSLPYKLVLLGIVAIKNQTTEWAIHKMFAQDRLEGEWFARTPRLMEFIETAVANDTTNWEETGKSATTQLARGLTD